MSFDHSSAPIVPVLVTSFRDFELEERVVRILSHRGFGIGERKIIGTRELLADEILITDGESHSNQMPMIAIPWQAREWDDLSLQRFINDQIFPPISTEGSWSPVLVIGQGEWSATADELVTAINSSHPLESPRALPVAQLASFDERDLRSALVPTRRFEERVRQARFANAECVLFLAGIERREIAFAHSMIEYQRRIHPHLELAFVLVGGRKARRIEAASLLEPFPIFHLEDERDDFLRIWPSPQQKKDRKFLEIREWLGSLHGDSRQSRNLSNRAPSPGARTPRRTRRPMATSR